ncbi:M20/M25/M40 family metallo-hydrolase [Limimaricola pyoseonensis]|uniref:Acetylornithine deacetylase/Succinyl-diaminopimelate desuccinylase n=1 Tax=Limimaricola pyoseonensis TaxID=521013 RepID=A0A1G7H1Y7_9RHOB|nr:M20/M25/M40 family metallo-hydrolase [Limimaricola pyoseonensis]SDE94159.1 Acetylornithine deacetylase/Succinyl-diaminopimelate desuccinylase [Limimaricola pyoseonensis]
MTLDPVLSHIDANIESAVERLLRLLRIPSISTDSAYRDECRAAADWLVEDLKEIGFVDAARRDTPGHPMVTGTMGEGARHLLFYGHYDVQPADPLELWDSPPFEPALEDTPAGKVIRGRGASDDKGQLMTFLEACRAWVAVHGALPARVSILFEGEEESGSPSLVPFLRAHADELRADLALICDTGLFDRDTPAITTMLRGLVGEEVIITGPDRDLHSGAYGGPAANPIKVLSRIIASLHDEDGRVTLPGFYDGVPEISDEMRAQWEGLGFDAEGFLGAVGLSRPAGEADRGPLEMLWARPTCEVNGIAGGYAGAGFKTVLPSKASAKISFRLVGRQDPLAIRDAFRARVREMLPEDCKVEFHEHGAAPASVMATDDPAFETARQALSAEWPRPAAFVGAGGSIPIAGYFKTELGMDSMLIGFGNDDDLIHSPNEKYDLRSFHKGIRSWARVLAALSEKG